MAKYFLAVDGGGTKTHVVCADETGQIIGEGVSGPTSLTATNPGAAGFNLKESVRQALESFGTNPPEIAAMVIGLAGMDTQLEKETAERVFTQVLTHLHISKIELVNDIVIALENGSDAANAVALISGTGSNCYGRNDQAQTAKTGGMDYILSDQGSGYAIGRAVLRSALKSYDGRANKTELELYVCEHFHIQSVAELKDKVHNPTLTKTEIAELAQVCLRAFDQGDEVARQIFDHTIDELVSMASTVLNRLNIHDQTVDCVLAGSITKIAYIENALIERLKAQHPQLNVIIPVAAPVHGALKLAMKMGV